MSVFLHSVLLALVGMLMVVIGPFLALLLLCFMVYEKVVFMFTEDEFYADVVVVGGAIVTVLAVIVLIVWAAVALTL